MFFNEIFEGVNPSQGVATYEQLLLAVKEGRETEIDGMRISIPQAKYLLETFNKISKKEGREHALEFLGDYGQIGFQLNKHAKELANVAEYEARKDRALGEGKIAEVGDYVIVSAPNNVEGKRGRVVEFNPRGTFIKVDCGHDGVHTMHPTDVRVLSESLNEISNKTVDDYYSAVIDQQREREGKKFNPQGSFERLPAKRQKGIDRATQRILRTADKSDEIEEGRDGVYDERNPKIDLFHKDTKQYLGSTNWYSSLKSAIAGMEEKKPELKGKVIAHINHAVKEGAVDELEQRRISDLNDRMDVAKADAQRALKKGDRLSAEHCMKMFNKYKEERDSYYMVNEDDSKITSLKDRINQYEKMMMDTRLDDSNKKIIRQKINQAKAELAQISESTLKIPASPKPRDPNWKTMSAKARSGAAGAHDKGYTRKEKHKNRSLNIDEAPGAETLAHNERTEAGNLEALGLAEAQQKKKVYTQRSNGAKCWMATIRIKQPGYTGNVDAQAWAPNSAVARKMIMQQYSIDNSAIINIKEVKIVYEDESRLERRYNETGTTTGNAYNAESIEEDTYQAQFSSKEEAIAYAKDKVKSFRDPIDGIEIWQLPTGFDVVNTMNANGRNHVVANGGKKLGTVYQKSSKVEEVASYKTLQNRYSNVEKKYGDESDKSYPATKGRSLMKKIARTVYSNHGKLLQKNVEEGIGANPASHYATGLGSDKSTIATLMRPAWKEEGSGAFEYYVKNKCPTLDALRDKYHDDFEAMFADADPKDLAKAAQELKALYGKEVDEAYSKNPSNLDTLRALARDWQDGSDEAYDAISELGWNISDDRNGVYIIKQSDMSGRSKIYFPELNEGFQDFNKVEPYEVCLAGKPVKQFDYYEDARRFHDNWKKKLYTQGDKEKADKITLNPIMKEEYKPVTKPVPQPKKLNPGWALDPTTKAELKRRKERNKTISKWAGKDVSEIDENNWSHDPWSQKYFGPHTETVQKIFSVKGDNGKTYNVKAPREQDARDILSKEKPGVNAVSVKFVRNIMSEDDPCWKGYKQIGMKDKNGKQVPNCVPKNEAANLAQQAAIAINMKKANKKPKHVDEGNPNGDPWYAYDQSNPSRIKKFKTHSGAVRFTDNNRGWAVASSGYYHDKIANRKSDSGQDGRFDRQLSGMNEAQTDYQKRRQRERDIDAGKPVSRQPKNPQTDYARKRAREKRELELGESGIASALKQVDEAKKKSSGLAKACWKGYEAIGTKEKNGRTVPNCVPVKESSDTEELSPNEYYIWTAHFDDGTSKKVKVTSPQINLEKYYASKGKVVVKVDYDYTVHRKG